MSEFRKSQAALDSSNNIDWPLVVSGIIAIVGCMYLAVRAIH